MAGAHIQSGEPLKAMRQSLVVFDDECQRALSSITSDVARVSEWLRRDQLAYWSAQLRKREELVRVAKSDWLRAAHGPKYQRKQSGVEERKLLDKAKRSHTEAEEKLAAVKRWTAALEQQSRPLLQSSSTLATLLHGSIPRALARLDQMLDSLDDYLRHASDQ